MCAGVKAQKTVGIGVKVLLPFVRALKAFLVSPNLHVKEELQQVRGPAN